MIRRFVRWLIGPAVRWAYPKDRLRLYVARDEQGAFIGFFDPHGHPYTRTITVHEARCFGMQLHRAAWDHSEGVPLTVDPDAPVPFQSYPPE